MIFLRSSSRGFTLVELMVVIAIIGVLAGALFPSVGKYIDRSRQTRAISDLQDVTKIIMTIRMDLDIPLRYITLSNCTDCGCRNGFGGTVSSPICLSNWTGSVTRIMNKYGGSPKKFYVDPWGYPYLLDENEGETLCTPDTFLSYGLVISRRPLDPQIIPRIPEYARASSCGIESISTSTSVNIYE